MYIYCIFILHNTRPIAWQSICDLRSCKAMTLVRFISLRRHFIYFFAMCFFSFFFFFFLSDIICFRWKWERGLQSSSNDGKDRSTAFDIFHLASLSVSSQVQQCLLFFFLFFFENTGNISGTVRGEGRRNILSMDMQHPVDNRRTDGPRLIAQLSQERMDRQWWRRDEEMFPPLHVRESERERWHWF